MSTTLRLGLAGPCGAGKSTLGAALVENPGVQLVQEIPPEVLATESPYSELDMESIQQSFIRNRLGQVNTMKARLVVFDRAVAEDVEVFLPLHRELGGLSEAQFLSLLEIAGTANRAIGPMDANVVMSAEPSVLRRRISGDQRPKWLQNSFGRQLDLYRIFVSRITGPILEFDTTNHSLEEVSPIAAWIVESVKHASEGQEPRNSHYDLAWKFISPVASDNFVGHS